MFTQSVLILRTDGDYTGINHLVGESELRHATRWQGVFAECSMPHRLKANAAGWMLFIALLTKDGKMLGRIAGTICYMCAILCAIFLMFPLKEDVRIANSLLMYMLFGNILFGTLLWELGSCAIHLKDTKELLSNHKEKDALATHSKS